MDTIRSAFDSNGHTREKRVCKRWASFLVSYLIQLVSFISFSASVFLLPLKNQFHLSQTQADLLVSMLFVGMVATVPCGFLITKYGIRFGAGLGAGISFFSYTCIALSCGHPWYMQDRYWLLVLLFFLAGCSQGTLYLVSLRSGLQNFSDKNKSAINGFLQTACSIGPILINLFYDVYFSYSLTGGYLQGFFGFIACSSGIFCLLGVLAFGDYHEDKDKVDVVIEDENEDSENLPLGIQRKNSPTTYGSQRSSAFEDLANIDMEVDKDLGSEDISILETFKNHTFSVIMLLLLALGVAAANGSQAVVYATSLGMDQFAAIIPYVGIGFCLFFKPLFGMFVSHFSDRIPLTCYLVVTLLITMFCMLFSMLFLDTPTMLFINQLSMETVTGIGICVNPIIIATEFGMKTFSRNFGIAIAVWGFACFLFEAVFGLVYDAHVVSKDTYDCYGMKCFRWSFTISLIFCVMILYPVVSLAKKDWKNHKVIAKDVVRH